ncbi:ABC transporter ATP-binding protein [Halieaceae bacterium IMCC14734]|uniref:ABC transporter ATP-binding protein n=1 Tax=Candidatus Litorirhabdus singularis TaxID=2518993 RepID=A0ABT3TG48_9GAMM|nr:ABC transporter ATP-binding protein [Candidatus Litorirhabdus singularis]MCX2980795.1 ABC transporter ATP-binding protein [Candidatus Litorirhabdus singularis]
MSKSQSGGLAVSGVSKTFMLRSGQAVKALDDINFELQENSVGVLLGPSGCGKSTLLRIIAGLETQEQGDISVAGKPIHGPGVDRGMVFQNYSSFPWLTVEDNVAFGLKARGESLSLAEGVVDHFIRAVNLDGFEKAYPHQLSGGMQQRVAIARSLASNPAVLLMDEPFGALDPETRWQMQSLLLDIVKKECTTVLMVSHDIEEALYLGDVVFFMGTRPGRILETIRPGFEKSSADRDAILDVPEYRELERDIRQMMRSQSIDCEH